ncbi:MAG: ABC transporter permease [Clostridiales bacterium]|nr:ABC transporter permease [Clostridiales bacterium]
MMTLLEKWFPHVVDKPAKFLESIQETLVMTGWAGGLMLVFGLILGVMLIVTKKDGILECPVAFQILDKAVNLFRSIPFVILIAFLMNITKAIMGTRIGIKGVIVPLVVGSVPFFSRQVESALAGVNPGLIEAAKAMGVGPIGIIFRVYLREGLAAIARGATITLISLIGLTAMAGYVGAGGLGDYAITYGYNYNRMDIVWASVIVIVIIVTVIQFIGTLIARKATH